ncbi:alpha amylase C-terminal domain-containing protein [Carboxylicivirga mesophila]|uniref:Alpha amylase C-terminal domain-containing protein n=1 Tax=Carboxylicivirga mesophila TaxID=1166478 RepID=A0ABS5KDP7_9BACT|nr:alpha-amylase family glycosyl hydrolase [Carboxylicivirga mesophila]MBS2212463.1 alpha amylase C-terminal domain-containing protein [Carboxylicivirga mesophila]
MHRLLAICALALATLACQQQKPSESKETTEHKTVVYQVFTRLFGNTITTNKAWGTIEENGVGKFSDFTDKALSELKDLGITHIWYTGVPHHAVINDYKAYGISNDDPDVVKGRAGSPYAVKDYYNVNPDLAENPANRLEEFKALIDRTHQHGMKVLIDIVPNHVARHYEGKNNQAGVLDFGAQDDTSVAYAVNNNFYYIPGESFKVPDPENNYQPLGGEVHPLADGQFDENPAKWTGNGSRLAQPGFHDWYETVKINYGVRPDGTKDFPELPEGYEQKDYKAHYAFWQNKTLPDSWLKFRDIALYWTELGVDGFRFDMAEMVPVEFWSFMNSSIKMANEDAFLLAEVYNPSLYRDYIHKGKMDYLYDKVELYDTLKHIMQGHGLTDNLPAIQNGLKDIEHHMLHFLENHDEQRIASPEFAGDAKKGMPAMVVSTTISTAPTMIYFGQEVGEPGAEDAGFGSHSRTSIFDYIGVPHHQRWMNNGAFDGGQLSNEEKKLRDFYKRLLTFSVKSPALMGEYEEIHTVNRSQSENYNDKVFSFVRWCDTEQLIICSNFQPNDSQHFQLTIPAEIIKQWQLPDGEYQLTDQLYGSTNQLFVEDGEGTIDIHTEPLASFIYKIDN